MGRSSASLADPPAETELAEFDQHAAELVNDRSDLRVALSGIPGWVDYRALPLWAAISRCQIEMGIEGGVCELGAFCGAAFIPLALLRRPGEPAVAVDLFEDQDKNNSRSGYTPGQNSKHLLQDACKSFCLDDVTIHQTATSEMTSGQYPQAFRMIRIDAGHSWIDVLDDLHLARNWAAPGAVIIIDDVCNQDWPDVAAAVNEFVRSNVKTSQTWQKVRPLGFAYGEAYLLVEGPRGWPNLYRLVKSILKHCPPAQQILWHGVPCWSWRTANRPA